MISEHERQPAAGDPLLASWWRNRCADGALAATCAFVATLFVVSPLLLEHYGVSYITSGGGPASKFHPATYFALLAFVLRCLATRRPFSTAAKLLTHDPGIVILSIAIGIVGFYAATISHTPVTPVVDTFVLPILCLVLLRDLDPAIRRRLAFFVIAILCVNAAMAMIEMFRGTHTITLPIANDISSDPTRADAVFDWRAEVNTDWRATALLGHPLVNGMEIATFIVCLGARGARWLPMTIRLPLLALQLLSMGAFGARASLVLTLATLGIFATRGLIDRWRTGLGLPPRIYAFALMSAAGLAMVALLLYQTGFFDHLIERFSDDAGSAKTRLTMFELFAPFDWSGLLLGPDQDVVATWQRLYGLEFGIESSWVGLALTYGLVVAAIIMVGLAAFVRSVLRSSGEGAFAALTVFLICSSVMASMSGKTISFGMAIVIVLLFLPRASERGRIRTAAQIGTQQTASAPELSRFMPERAAYTAAGFSHPKTARFGVGGVS